MQSISMCSCSLWVELHMKPQLGQAYPLSAGFLGVGRTTFFCIGAGTVVGANGDGKCSALRTLIFSISFLRSCLKDVLDDPT